MVLVKVTDKNFHIRETFCFPGIGFRSLGFCGTIFIYPSIYNSFPSWSSPTIMSSPSEGQDERSLGASSLFCAVLGEICRAIKALSSTSFMSVRDQNTDDRDGAEWHDLNQFAEGSSLATGRGEGIAASLLEIPSHLGSEFAEPEVRLGVDESAMPENGPSKMSKIRSMYGNDMEKWDMEVSLFQEIRYPEVRSVLADLAPSSGMSSHTFGG
jgi:hypothetical protein